MTIKTYIVLVQLGRTSTEVHCGFIIMVHKGSSKKDDTRENRFRRDNTNVEYTLKIDDKYKSVPKRICYYGFWVIDLSSLYNIRIRTRRIL